MEYWEFLLQKEGDRSWLPIKSPTIEIEAGRYRVVVHSSRTNADVEICVTHHSIEEIPPKRRSQKRSRRTNLEGLMVVIPFTYLKPGLWELRCCGDIMSDFLGKSWQQAVQLQVLAKATAVSLACEPASPVVETIQTDVQASLSENFPSNSDPNLAVEPAPTETETAPLSLGLATSEVPEPDKLVMNETDLDEAELEPATSLDIEIPLEPAELDENNTTLTSNSAEEVTLTNSSLELLRLDTEVPLEPAELDEAQTTLTSNSAEEVTLTNSSLEPLRLDTEISLEPTELDEAQTTLTNNSTDEAKPTNPILEQLRLDTVAPFEPAEVDENNSTLPRNSTDEAKPTNPILDESLQMLEQILQQVLEPVLQDFDRSEPLESPIPITPESELTLETDINQQGLTLTLDEEALVARRGESLTIAGQVDVLDINQLNGNQPSSALNCVFQGTLRYELRDPQSSQILLDVQQPLPEQALPLAFSHSLEIPPDCKTRLILGKVTLYGSSPAALASQPFTVTADLNELLEAIIPGSKAMPVAKMMVLANNLATFQDNEEETQEPASPPLKQALLNLVDPSQSHQTLPLQPASRQPLPPQIYQPAPTHKASKSLQLPTFPKVQPVATAEFSAAVSTPEGVEVKQEAPVEPPVAPADDLPLETLNLSPVDTAEDTAPESRLQEAVLQSEDEASGVAPVLVADSSARALDAAELSDSPVVVADLTLDGSDAPETETPEASQLTADSQLDTVPRDRDPALLSEATDSLATVTPTADSHFSDSDEPEQEMQSAEIPVAELIADQTNALDNAFQALKIQDRFWLRLNSIATDAELSESLKSELYPSRKPANEVEVTEQLNPNARRVDFEEVTGQLNSDATLVDFDESMWEESDDFGSDTADTDRLQPPLLEQNTFSEEAMPAQPSLVEVAKTNWAANEIVVEDEELPELELSVIRSDDSEIVYPAQPIDPQPKPSHVPQPEPRNAPPLEPSHVPPLQLELPLPAPAIFLPTKELAAGEPVTVRIKLPPHPARLYVKLWVQDRQSRSLLDGPRWLVDLLPDGSGAMEAMTQLTVPFGSVEIRFEAIAVDVYSQRESHKVTVDCVVVPPDSPNLSLEEFEA